MAQNETIPLDHFYVKRQDGSIFRKFFSKFRVGLSTGYGATFLRHELNGYGIYQPTTGSPATFIALSPPPVLSVIYNNWITDSSPQIIAIDPSGFLVHSDTTTIGFRGKAFNIPVTATLHYEFKRYRIGIGYSYEYQRIGEFESISFQDRIGNFSLDNKGGFIRKYFVMAGVSFYRIDDFLFTADLQIGNFQPKTNFNRAILQPSLYYNFGVTIERDLSEYFRAFIRPSFEFKNYDLGIPGNGLNHNMNAFYLNIGASYRLPELRKCFHRQCQAQINHAHGNREYRSRMHPIYKKQNPGYGENNKELIKYKGKNKRKLNPY